MSDTGLTRNANLGTQRKLSYAGDRPTLDEIKRWPPTIDIDPAYRAIGTSRSAFYELVKRGQLPPPLRVIRLGHRYKLVTATLIELLEGGTAA